jgi:hypothetical protein
MLRALAALLLLANLLFLAWTQGWLSPALPLPHQGEREPERLARQLRPEAVQPVSAAAASAARAAAGVCLEAGPFNDADIAAAEVAITTAVAAAGLPATAWTRRDQALPPRWLVYVGRFADDGALRAMEQQLRQTGVPFERLAFPPDLAPGFQLSKHDAAAAAEAALAAALQRGVNTARIVALPAVQAHWLRLPSAGDAVRQALETISLPAGAVRFEPCPAAP